MWDASLFALRLLLTTACLHTAFAGEIVLWPHTRCDGDATVFSSDASTGCVAAEQNINEPNIYGASTSRNIGSHCAFSLYTDAKCAHLVGTIHSAGPVEKCLHIPAGLKAYRITCQKPSSAGGPILPAQVPNFFTSGIQNYFQPRTSFHGKPSGHTDVHAIFPLAGSKAAKPGGSPAVAGVKLANALFAHVPPHTYTYSFTIEEGGTLYHVKFEGDKNNGYTVERTAGTIGHASVASIMADAVTAVQHHPRTWSSFELGDQSAGDIEIGYVNITYTV